MVANDILVTRDNIQLNTGLVMIKHAHVLYERKEYVTPAIRHSQRKRERAQPNGGSAYVTPAEWLLPGRLRRRLLIWLN